MEAARAEAEAELADAEAEEASEQRAAEQADDDDSEDYAAILAMLTVELAALPKSNRARDRR